MRGNLELEMTTITSKVKCMFLACKLGTLGNESETFFPAIFSDSPTGIFVFILLFTP